MTTPGPTPYNPITSTKQLIPDGIAGYAKAVAAFVGFVIATVLQNIPDLDADLKKWLTLASVLVSGIAVWGLPNAVKPTPPAPVEPADGPQI